MKLGRGREAHHQDKKKAVEKEIGPIWWFNLMIVKKKSESWIVFHLVMEWIGFIRNDRLNRDDDVQNASIVIGLSVIVEWSWVLMIVEKLDQLWKNTIQYNWLEAE